MTDQTPQSDSRGIQMDENETEEARVLDPEEYTQKRRLRDIFNARERVSMKEQEVTASKAKHEASGRKYPELQARMIVLSAAQEFIKQVEPLMINVYPEVGEKYWTEVDLGTATITPPKEMTEATESNIHNGYREVKEPAEPKTVEFKGIDELLNADEKLTATFTAKVTTKHDPDGKVEKAEVSEPIPRQIVMKAVRQTSLFLAEVGLDLDPEEGLPFHEFE